MCLQGRGGVCLQGRGGVCLQGRGVYVFRGEEVYVFRGEGVYDCSVRDGEHTSVCLKIFRCERSEFIENLEEMLPRYYMHSNISIR